MKTYNELSVEGQRKAVDYWLTALLTEVLEGSTRFNDRANGDGLQSRIDNACTKAESMRTPWFAGEYVMDSCREDLTEMAMVDAAAALYSTPEDPPICLDESIGG